MHAAMAILLTFLNHSPLYAQLPGEVTPSALLEGTPAFLWTSPSWITNWSYIPRFRGTVSDPSVSEILFRFNLNKDPDQKLRFFGDVVNGAFDIQMAIDSLGEYTLGLYMGEKAGRFLS